MGKDFWANVRTISQEIGYTARGESRILVPALAQICIAYARLNLSTAHIRE